VTDNNEFCRREATSMNDVVKVVFGYGATEGKTKWRRMGRLRNPSMERGNEGVRPYGLYFAEIGPSCPFAITVTLAVPAEEHETETLAAKADDMFLEQFPGHTLVD
jgi:hypothetical protein